ncbi:hypothetical protein [Nocardioides sp. GY 10127]|uniref:hypothetical protein n=1 Tax=Nocardioides sp. GY 10127 TaxID=2569762 RepID=UPI0010A947A8|nr:hypothetical protein [Nocardioides sp. GY 10127]TIC85539.1 hypothetical protein E8D37_02595 [Nocardioides sp. GY 10127]
MWVADELTGDVDRAIEALIVSTLAATSGVQTQAFSSDIAETIRKSITKTQIAGSSDPIVVMHPSDYEALCLLRSAGTEKTFIATSAVTQAVPGGAVSLPVGASAQLSWGAPICLSVAATAGTAWVLARDALQLFVDGAVLVDWSEAAGFTRNEVTGRAETRVLPAVLRPFSCVKTTLA